MVDDLIKNSQHPKVVFILIITRNFQSNLEELENEQNKKQS